jgi:hypothetical protein
MDGCHYHRLQQATSMAQMRGLKIIKVGGIHRITLRLGAIGESSVSHISARAGCRQKPQMVVKFVR